jgi:hypothetical protein
MDSLQVVGSTTKAIGRTKVVEVGVKSSRSELSFLVVKKLSVDCLLGEDWCEATNVRIDYNNDDRISFPVSSNCNQYDSFNGLEYALLADEDFDDLDLYPDWNHDVSVPTPILNLKPDIKFKFINKLVPLIAKATASSINQLGKCKTAPLVIELESKAFIHIGAYRRSPAEHQLIEEEVKRLLDAGMISISKSPYSFQPVLVKKEGGQKRFCVDYRPLNKITIPIRWPLKNIRDIVDATQGCTIFSKLDCKSGFHQIPIHPESRKYTAFST